MDTKKLKLIERSICPGSFLVTEVRDAVILTERRGEESMPQISQNTDSQTGHNARQNISHDQKLSNLKRLPFHMKKR